ncbi:hypothetical protein B0H14DRAFT_3570346 [Mycena olivaceomarginata]|nr:hypothetical protein B0H14DRAFT_3570346 [Mycena olivaceomarginata]
MAKSAVVITISPLRLIQDNNVAEFYKYGIPSIAIDSFTPEDPALWKTIREHNMYQHYSVSSEQCGPYQGHIPRFAKLLHDPKWVKRIKLLQIDEAHFITTTERKGRKQRSDQHSRTSARACVFISLQPHPVQRIRLPCLIQSWIFS